jgi:hypothetical protein
LKRLETELDVQCDLAADLPLLPEELKLLQDLLPDVLQAMAWQITVEEK